MNITGKTKLFIKPVKGADGNIAFAYQTSVGRKSEDGNYVNISLDVYFAKENFPKEKLAKLDSKYAYDLEIEDGFLSVRTWEKDGEIRRAPCVQVLKAKITGKKEISPKETKPAEDLPF